MIEKIDDKRSNYTFVCGVWLTLSTTDRLFPNRKITCIGCIAEAE